MSTTNGFGTLYYDWDTCADGTVEATKWSVAAFFPIIPLGRHRLRVHSSGKKPSFFSLGLTNEPFALSYDVIESVPMDSTRLLKTYLMGWVVTPLILLIPMIMLLAIVITLTPPANAPQQPALAFRDSVFPWGAFAVLLWWGIFVSWVLDRATGRHLAHDDNAISQPND